MTTATILDRAARIAQHDATAVCLIAMHPTVLLLVFFALGGTSGLVWGTIAGIVITGASVIVWTILMNHETSTPHRPVLKMSVEDASWDLWLESEQKRWDLVTAQSGMSVEDFERQNSRLDRAQKHYEPYFTGKWRDGR